jgi:hypothetical protein
VIAVSPNFEHLEEFEIPPGIPPYFESIFDDAVAGDWYLRDVEALGGTAYETLPANATDETKFGPGNTAEVKLVNAQFELGDGRVWIKNQTNDLTGPGFDRFTPVPGMDPQPDYGNTAMLNQTQQSFDNTDGPVNEGFNSIPDIYFK